jgi:outer membrane biosynthesis protein TonB
MGILASLAGVLLLCIAVVKFCPVHPERPPRVETSTEHEVIQLEVVAPTRQEAGPPPPPRGVGPPISVPDEIMLPDESLDLETSWQSPAATEGGGSISEGTGQDSMGTGISEQSPQPIHFVEPAYPDPAWKRQRSAQIVVEIKVNRQGRAATERIVDRYRLEYTPPNRSVSATCCSREITQRELTPASNRSPVDYLGDGFEEAALNAASKWRFKPPTKDGQTLTSYAILTFTFGQ